MGDADGAFRFVDVLPACARGTIDVDLQVFFVDVDIDFFHFGEDGDRGGGGVDAAIGFGLRNALHAVDAGLELQAREDASSTDLGHAFLQAADVVLRKLQDFELPALEDGVFAVHIEQEGAEERGFVTARACADFEQGVAFIRCVFWQQHFLDAQFKLGEAGADQLDFLFCFFPHVGFGKHLLGVGKLISCLVQIADGFGDRGQVGIFFREFRKLVGRDAGLREGVPNFLKAFDNLGVCFLQ